MFKYLCVCAPLRVHLGGLERVKGIARVIFGANSPCALEEVVISHRWRVANERDARLVPIYEFQSGCCVGVLCPGACAAASSVTRKCARFTSPMSRLCELVGMSTTNIGCAYTHTRTHKKSSSEICFLRALAPHTAFATHGAFATQWRAPLAYV